MTCASITTKVTEGGIMQLILVDSNAGIKLENDLNNPDQLKEAVEKLETLGRQIYELQYFIVRNYLKNKSQNLK